MDTFAREEALLLTFFFPSQNYFLKRAVSFLFAVDAFLKRTWFVYRQTGCHKRIHFLSFPFDKIHFLLPFNKCQWVTLLRGFRSTDTQCDMQCRQCYYGILWLRYINPYWAYSPHNCCLICEDFWNQSNCKNNCFVAIVLDQTIWGTSPLYTVWSLSNS